MPSQQEPTHANLAKLTMFYMTNMLNVTSYPFANVILITYLHVGTDLIRSYGKTQTLMYLKETINSLISESLKGFSLQSNINGRIFSRYNKTLLIPWWFTVSLYGI